MRQRIQIVQLKLLKAITNSNIITLWYVFCEQKITVNCKKNVLYSSVDDKICSDFILIPVLIMNVWKIFYENAVLGSRNAPSERVSSHYYGNGNDYRCFFLLTYLVKKISLVITAYVGIFSFRPRLSMWKWRAHSWTNF